MHFDNSPLVLKRKFSKEWFTGLFKRKMRKYLLCNPRIKVPFNRQGLIQCPSAKAVWTLQLRNLTTNELVGQWHVDVITDYNMYPDMWYDRRVRIIKTGRDRFFVTNFPPIHYSSERPENFDLVIKSHDDDEGNKIILLAMGGDL